MLETPSRSKTVTLLTGEGVNSHHWTSETPSDTAKTFDKKRSIFGEHKKRLHKSMIDTIDNENGHFIDNLLLMV